VLAVADALLIGQNVDAAICSILRDVSRMPRVYAANERLLTLGIRLLGAVMSGARCDGYGSYYHYPSRYASSR
jgi:polysaccharide biosynthesis transport protein